MQVSIVLGLLFVPALAIAQEETDLDDQVRDNPDDVELRLDRAETMLAEGRFDEAMVDCEHAASLAPNDPSIALTRGRIHQAMGELERAEVFFTKYLKRGQPTIEVYLLRGGIREETSRLREALADYDGARRLAAQLSKKNELDLLQLIDIEDSRARVLDGLNRKKEAKAAREHAKHLRTLTAARREPSAT